MANLRVVPLKDFINQHPGGLQRLLDQRENIVCRSRKTGKTKRIQLRALYQNNPIFWEREYTWQYYIDRRVAHQTAEALRLEAEARTTWDKEHAPSGDGIEQPESVQAPATPAPPLNAAAEVTQPPTNGGSNFGDVYAGYAEMEPEERIGVLQAATRRLDALAQQQENVEKNIIAEALVDATENATMVNRATLFEALRMGNEQAQAHTQEMVKETHKIVWSAMQLVGSSVYDDELIRTVVEKSNGTVIQHMTRVFLGGLKFLLYYNKQVMTEGIANRIRTRFTQRYKDFYRQLLPHLHEDYLTVDRVFLGGMKALNEIEINMFATGFLVHDVGKAEDIEYHEGNAGYDRSTVERHVKLGYKAIIEKTNYPRETALITGYHHEYYGHPTGYGYFREFLDAYKKSNPQATHEYIMAYTTKLLDVYKVLAYFPAKMLEIVDVFDSLTDPNRKYRSPLSESEALELIVDEFIVNNLKIDPILFQIYLEFREEQANS